MSYCIWHGEDYYGEECPGCYYDLMEVSYATSPATSPDTDGQGGQTGQGGQAD